MSNSPLISGTLLSPNHSNGRAGKRVSRITPHYMAWYVSAETCCRSFLPVSRQASANYCIGKDGEIWLNVEESDRAWTTASAYNDNMAITIECANYVDNKDGHVYGQLPDATWKSLVSLCADICTRYGFRLNYTGNDTGNLTKHKWYANTDCPGPWLDQQFDRLAKEVNLILDFQEGKVMTCIFQQLGNQTLYFYDGGDIHPLADLEELEAVKTVYRKATGREIPEVSLLKPQGEKFLNAMKRKL